MLLDGDNVADIDPALLRPKWCVREQWPAEVKPEERIVSEDDEALHPIGAHCCSEGTPLLVEREYTHEEIARMCQSTELEDFRGLLRRHSDFAGLTSLSVMRNPSEACRRDAVEGIEHHRGMNKTRIRARLVNALPGTGVMDWVQEEQSPQKLSL